LKPVPAPPRDECRCNKIAGPTPGPNGHYTVFSGKFFRARRPAGMRLRHVSLLHRHGDRSPIIKMLEPSALYWSEQLAPPPTTAVGWKACASGGEPLGLPYGQLTKLGASQLHARGRELRKFLLQRAPTSFWWLAPAESIAVTSTAFPRTVHSTRALLSALLAAEGEDGSDGSGCDGGGGGGGVYGGGLAHAVRHEGWMDMIPDMGVSEEQVNAEAAVWARGAARDRFASAEDARLRLGELLVRVGVLPPAANPEQVGAGVSWNLLHDATNCAAVHGAAAGLAPALCSALEHGGAGDAGATGSGDTGVAHSDIAELRSLSALAAEHNTWRWFTLQSDTHVARLSVGPFVERYVAALQHASAGAGRGEGGAPLVQVYSAHDSTMVSLMAALGLKSAAGQNMWPTYASVLRAEVLEPAGGGDDVVRFFLNNEIMHVSGVPELKPSQLAPIWQ